ncbi:hypothetical protein PIB30_016508 [Stylosanthes scabra]|uniref:Uncharacterized protein n=1 Tax=Stylosanthes scabra TaxID=79078 RepID=A0ABU6Z6U7_9FABA|nr:hypothetical protein [Stylosanthes scabra]
MGEVYPRLQWCFIKIRTTTKASPFWLLEDKVPHSCVYWNPNVGDFKVEDLSPLEIAMVDFLLSLANVSATSKIKEKMLLPISNIDGNILVSKHLPQIRDGNTLIKGHLPQIREPLGRMLLRQAEKLGGKA